MTVQTWTKCRFHLFSSLKERFRFLFVVRHVLVLCKNAFKRSAEANEKLSSHTVKWSTQICQLTLLCVLTCRTDQVHVFKKLRRVLVLRVAHQKREICSSERKVLPSRLNAFSPEQELKVSSSSLWPFLSHVITVAVLQLTAWISARMIHFLTYLLNLMSLTLRKKWASKKLL